MRLHEHRYSDLKDPARNLVPVSYYSSHYGSQHMQRNARSHNSVLLPSVTDGRGCVANRGFGPAGPKPNSLQSANARYPVPYPSVLAFWCAIENEKVSSRRLFGVQPDSDVSIFRSIT